MLDFLRNNLATIIIATIVIGLMVWVVVHRIVQKRKGTAPDCGCGCAGCSQAGKCH